MIIVEMKMTPMMAIITTRMAALIMKCLHNKIMTEGRSTIIIIITRWVGGTVQVFSSPLLFPVVWQSRTEPYCRFLRKTVVFCDHHLVLPIWT